MSLDFLNELSAQTEAEESPNGFVPHPTGRFTAEIEKVELRHWENKSIFDIYIRTKKGSVIHNVWGFSEAELEEAKQRQEAREKILYKIAQTKRIFVDTKVWTFSEAKSKNWTDIEQTFVKLQGCKCEVVVKPNHKNPDKLKTWINEYRDLPDQIDQKVNSSQGAVSNRSMGSNDGNDTPTRRPPGAGCDLDGIPF